MADESHESGPVLTGHLRTTLGSSEYCHVNAAAWATDREVVMLLATAAEGTLAWNLPRTSDEILASSSWHSSSLLVLWPAK
ncbi:MAG: hypothetical protein AB9869_19825 [Verrucomicrobiia bacterium]